MPRNKDLKRLTRSRMRKTGESYTTARAQLLDKRRRRAAPELGPEYAELAGMSDAAVEKATGRPWEGWVEALDQAGASRLPHREIAGIVRRQHGLGSWWAQTVTVGYERIRGLREVGQRRDGTYDVSRSRTFAVPVDRLWAAFRSPGARRRWLQGAPLRVRKATPEKSLRATWEDGTPVEVSFTAKGESKSQVAVQHRKLGSREVAERMKCYWGERLTALGELLRRG